MAAPEPAAAVDARGHSPHPEAQRLEQQPERAVELVAETAAPPGDDLGEQISIGQRDRLAEVNAQVLERYGHLVSPVQDAQRIRVRTVRSRAGDTAEIIAD